MKVPVYVISILACLIAAFVLWQLLENLLIPDPCYYHFPDHKPSACFLLFYDLSDAGHPAPTMLTYIIVLTTGSTSGIFVAWKLCRRFIRE